MGKDGRIRLEEERKRFPNDRGEGSKGARGQYKSDTKEKE